MFFFFFFFSLVDPLGLCTCIQLPEGSFSYNRLSFLFSRGLHFHYKCDAGVRRNFMSEKEEKQNAAQAKWFTFYEILQDSPSHSRAYCLGPGVSATGEKPWRHRDHDRTSVEFFFRLLAQVGSFVCFVAASRRPDYYMLLRSYIGAAAWHWWFLPMKKKEAERKLARPNSFFIQSITAMKEAQQGPRRWLILHSTSFYPFLCSRHS